MYDNTPDSSLNPSALPVVENSSSDKYKITTIILIIFIILLLAGALLFYFLVLKNETIVNEYQENKKENVVNNKEIVKEEENSVSNIVPQDKYSGWNTYVDSIHNISFRYPKDWITEEKISIRTTNTEGKPVEVLVKDKTRNTVMIFHIAKGLTHPGVTCETDSKVFLKPLGSVIIGGKMFYKYTKKQGCESYDKTFWAEQSCDKVSSNILTLADKDFTSNNVSMCDSFSEGFSNGKEFFDIVFGSIEGPKIYDIDLGDWKVSEPKVLTQEELSVIDKILESITGLY